MKKVLIIANQYPPMGGSGVQRSCKFVKYLDQFGYTPVVLTREMNKGILDYSLLDDLPNHTIYRTKAYDLATLPGILSLVGKVFTRKILIPDGDILWSIASFQKACEIIRTENIEIIYSTSFPYSDHLLGLRLKKEFPDIPWVVDFRDEWTKNPYIIDMKYPKFRQHREKIMEKRVVAHCDAFVTNTIYMLNNFLEDYKDLEKKAYVIPNGYDDSDFNAFDKKYVPKSAFKITYTGAMYGRRKPDKVMEAIRNLIDQSLIDKNKFQLQLIGGMDVDKMKSTIHTYRLNKIVTLESYMPHKDAINAMIKSDVLLLLIGEGVGAKNFSSGKIFEYINCNRTILAVVPSEGAAAEIIAETESGVICDTSSVKEIEGGILELYHRWEAGNLQREPNWETIKKYHRKELTQSLAGIFNGLDVE